MGALTIREILEILEKDFEVLKDLYDNEDWKFYKFGRGGPYNNVLRKLQEKADRHDPDLFRKFGIKEETASFKKLIVLSLSVAMDSQERYKDINLFGRQIKRMLKNAS